MSPSLHTVEIATDPAMPPFSADAGRDGFLDILDPRPTPSARSSCTRLVDAVQAALRHSERAVSDLTIRLRRSEEQLSAAEQRGEAVARLATDYIRQADLRIAAALRRLTEIEAENRFLLDLVGRAPDGAGQAPG